MSGLSIAVLLGSVRRDRVGTRASTLVIRELERRGHQVQLVDPLELQLPLLDRMYKEHPKGEAPEPADSTHCRRHRRGRCRADPDRRSIR
jgi:NAD(P)H-dependent FMN reductase